MSAPASPEESHPLPADGLLQPTRHTSDLPHALSNFEVLNDGRRPAFFFDFDGTLTPIVNRPEDALLGGEMRNALQHFAERFPVAVISGRDLSDVQERVGLAHIAYAGSHGFDLHAPGIDDRPLPELDRFPPLLDRAENELRRKLEGIEGAFVERKRFSVAVHFRLVKPELRPRVEEIALEVLSQQTALRAGRGKMVIELQPDLDWDKGKALLWLRQRLNLSRPDVHSIYLGDDLTDEDAFAAIEHDGTGIVIWNEQPRPTRARYLLADPGEVLQFMQQWSRQT